jgi:integrase
MATIRKHRDKWQVQVRRAGIRPMSKSFAVRKDALEWARHIERQADRHELPTDPKALQSVTLGDLVRRYRDTVSPTKKTAATETIVLNALLTRQICSKRLSELRTEDFAVYRDQRLKVIKPTSLKRELTPVRHLFEVARDEWGLPVKENPLDRLQLDAPDQRRERRLRPGEFEKLLDAAKACRNKFIPPVIRFAVATGMRRGEILAMRWTDLNREQRSLLIPETKNGHSRTIPLTSAALEVLNQESEGKDRIFPTTANAFRLAWEKVKLRARIEDLHFHDLRHEAISSFFEKGLSTPEVALISGHKDMRMLFRFSHATRQNILRQLDSLAKGATEI